MAASPTKTPTLKKDKKEESFLEKVTTLGRKKKIKDTREGRFLTVKYGEKRSAESVSFRGFNEPF